MDNTRRKWEVGQMANIQIGELSEVNNDKFGVALKGILGA